MSSLHTPKRHMNVLCLVLVLLVILSTQATADLYEDWAVVENNSGMPGAVAAQLSVDVTDPGGGQALFTFNNAGPLDFFIADIYFDDGALLAIASIDNTDPGVSFSAPASPGNLPGGNNVIPPFVTTTGFSADADPPVAANAVGPGESVGIVFNLQQGKTFANVIDAINVGFDPYSYYGGGPYDGWTEPSLRIGIHVQGIDGPWGCDQSDTYILTPVPGSVLLGLGMLGLSVAGLKLRKFA